MKKLIILSCLFICSCESVSIGTGYELMDPYYTYTEQYGKVSKIPYWKDRWTGIIRADTKLYEKRNSKILLEYEHISSIGPDHATYDGVNLMLKFTPED